MGEILAAIVTGAKRNAKEMGTDLFIQSVENKSVPFLFIREGLSAFYFHRIKGKDLPALYRAVELVREGRDLTPLYEVLERYGEQT